MPATNQNVKDFFALAGKTVTNAHLQKFADALIANSRIDTPNADDVVNWIYRQAKDFVNRNTVNKAQAAAEAAAVDLWE